MATNLSEADLDTIVPAGDEDNKVCDPIRVRLMANLLPTVQGPPWGDSPKMRGQERRSHPDGTLFQEKRARRVVLFDTSPPSGRRERTRDKGEARLRTRQCLASQHVPY